MTREEYELYKQKYRLELEAEQKQIRDKIFDLEKQIQECYEKYEELYLLAQANNKLLVDLENKKRNASADEKKQYAYNQKLLMEKQTEIYEERKKYAVLSKQKVEEKRTLIEKHKDLEIKKGAEPYIEEPEQN